MAGLWGLPGTPQSPVPAPASKGVPGPAGSHPSSGVSPQVYAGSVLYEHQMPSEPFWEAHDTLELQLSSPPAPDTVATLAVTVTFEAACPQRPSRLWRNKGEQHHGLANLGWGHKAKGQQLMSALRTWLVYYREDGQVGSAGGIRSQSSWDPEAQAGVPGLTREGQLGLEDSGLKVHGSPFCGWDLHSLCPVPRSLGLRRPEGRDHHCGPRRRQPSGQRPIAPTSGA